MKKIDFKLTRKHKIAAIALVSIAVVTFLYIKLFNKQNNLPPIIEKTLGDNSPEEFYNSLSAEQINTDSVFIAEMMVLCDSCGYESMLTFLPQLRNTPAYDYAVAKYIVKRDVFIDNIAYDVSTFIDTIKQQFTEDVVPILLQEVNDDLCTQLQKALEKFEEEGFAGIVRDTTSTLGFRLKDSTDLDKAWDEYVGDRYTPMLNDLMQIYSGNIEEFVGEYEKYSDYKPAKFNVNNFTLVKPSAVISKYTEDQTNQMIKDFAIDGGLLLVTIATFPIGGTPGFVIKVADAVYTTGSIGYELYNEYNSEEPSEEDKLMLAIAELVDLQIEHYLTKEFISYLDNEYKKIMKGVLNKAEENELSLNLPTEDNIEPIADLKKSILSEISQND